MKAYHSTMSNLIDAFSKLPGFGKRSAERVVFYLLKANKQEVENLSEWIHDLHEKTGFCEKCHHYTDQKICAICEDLSRDQGLLCIVEDPKDVIALEKTGSFSGLYHVLHGAISALDGIGPDELNFNDLIERVESGNFREVIIATNPNTEGDTTALYLAKVLESKGVQTSRLARGVPVGSHIEYTDQATLSRALEGRVDI